MSQVIVCAPRSGTESRSALLCVQETYEYNRSYRDVVIEQDKKLGCHPTPTAF